MAFYRSQILWFLVIVLALAGCSASKPQGEKEVFNSYQLAIDDITTKVNHYIHQETEAKRLPLVLDVFVEEFLEKETQNRINFGWKLRKDFSIALNKSRNELLATLEEKKADVIYQLSDQKLHKSFIIRGTFQQLDQEWVKVNLQLYQTSAQKVLTAYEACFPIKEVQAVHLAEFPAEVDKKFQLFKKKLVKTQLMSLKNLLELEWDPLYTSEHSKETQKIINDKVWSTVEIIRKPVWNFKDIEVKLAKADYLLQKIHVFHNKSFTVEVNPQVIEIVKQLREQLLEMQALPEKGVKTTLSLVAESSSNTPLEFQCSGIIHNKTVDLTVGKRNFVAKQGHCSTEEKKQLISWRKPYRLFSSDNLPVWATERNVLSRDVTVNGYISISPDDILELHLKGDKTFSIKGTEYYLRFYKK